MSQNTIPSLVKKIDIVALLKIHILECTPCLQVFCPPYLMPTIGRGIRATYFELLFLEKLDFEKRWGESVVGRTT
jgi:hypothetical protein